MRLLFIRHAEPDYANDSLTPKGEREAKLLSKIAPQLDLGDCYVSPLGRAQKTASYSLAATGKTAQTKDWLQEFDAKVDLNRYPELKTAFGDFQYEKDGRIRLRGTWDLFPSYFTEHPEYSDAEGWRDSEIAHKSNIVERYDYATAEFDKLLAQYGYVREGAHYKVERESTQTLTFFCHFGITNVLLSHLWSISPFVLWQNVCQLPSSVTEVVTEERQQGYAIFRALHIGDTTHLFIGGETPSFMARYTEVYSDMRYRHGSLVNPDEFKSDKPDRPPIIGADWNEGKQNG